MKKTLLVLSIFLFLSIFTVDFADAAYKSGSSTSTKVAMKGVVASPFKFYLSYGEQYTSTSSTTNTVTYRSSYFSMDRKVPAIANAFSGTAYYNGSTLVSETGAFTRYYPSQIVPAGHQTRNFQQSTKKTVRKKTGKSTNTSSIILSCSTYAPCIWNQKVTLSY